MRKIIMAALMIVVGFAPHVAEALQINVPEELLKRYHAVGYAKLSPDEQKLLGFHAFLELRRAGLYKVSDGALVKDDFNAPELSLSSREEKGENGIPRNIELPGRWRVWNSDPGIRIFQENGVLNIVGKSTVPGGNNFNGLVGNTFGNTDVVAVADMRVVAPPLDYPGYHVAMFHLCGSSPDRFNEVIFGQDRNGAKGWGHFHTGAPDESECEWPLLPERGDEARVWRTIRLEHEADTELSRAWIGENGVWTEIGEPRVVLMSTAKMELKVNAPSMDAPIEAYFDNARMYPRPETHPVRVVSYIAGDEGKGGVPDVSVELFVDGVDKPVAKARTDEFGRMTFVLPSDMVYPVSGHWRVTLKNGAVWESEIKRDELEGLYPGDVWVMRFNEAEMSGDEDWWRAIPGAEYVDETDIE